MSDAAVQQPQQDWFAANAPKAAAGGDWFAANAPKPVANTSPITPPAFNPSRTPAAASMHPSFMLGDENGDATPQSPSDVAKGMIRNVADVSAPVLAHRIGQRVAPGIVPKGDLYSGEGELKDVPENAALMMAGGLEGGVEGEAEPRMMPRSAPEPVQPSIAKPSAPGMPMRVGKVLANRIPGVKLAGDLVDAVKGPEAPAPKPAIARPAPPDFGTPQELRGTRINPDLEKSQGLARGPQRISDPAAALEHIPAPGKAGSMAESIASPKIGPIDTGKIGDLLNEGLGGKIPEGHTPVKGSSAIRSYKYDPATREFEASTASGTYIHGDVTPEQAKAFENASSKGKAWSELKNNSTYVGKIVNGERVNAKPPRDLGSASPNDLTPEWSKALADVKAKKSPRIARPN